MIRLAVLLSRMGSNTAFPELREKTAANACVFPEKIVILQSVMKRTLHIALTSILAIIFVMMASGVTFVHCNCSGKTTIVLSHTPEDNAQKQDMEGCMTVQSVSISPTTQVQPLAHDFHAFQPLVALVNDWTLSMLAPQEVVESQEILPNEGHSPPPRQYLRTLRRLLI